MSLVEQQANPPAQPGVAPEAAQQTLLELVLHYTVPGAATGFALYHLLERFDSTVSEQFLLGLLIALLVLSSSYWLMTQTGRRFIALAWAMALAAFLAAIGVWTWLRYYADEVTFDKPAFQPVVLVFLCCFVIVFVSLPFIRLFNHRRGTHTRPTTGDNDPGWYQALFEFSFNHFVVTLLGGLFGGAALLLVALFVWLFDIIGIELDDYLLDASVLVPVFVAGIATAIGVGRSHEELVVGLRSLVLALLRLLLPIHLLIVSSFLLAAAFMGIERIKTGIGVTAVLLVSIAIALSLCSATVGGSRTLIDKRLQRLVCRLLAFSTLPLALLAAYTLWLRIDQYGLTPERSFAALLVVIGLLHGVFYALSSVTPAFESFVQRSNTTLALVSIVLFALLLTPVLDIYRLSAKNQLTKFEKGQISADLLDIGFLKFRNGSAGREALQAISASAGAQAEPLQARLQALTQSSSWADHRSKNREFNYARDSSAYEAVLENGQLALVIARGDSIYRIRKLAQLAQLQESGAIDPGWKVEALLGLLKNHYLVESDCITGTIKCAVMVTDQPVIAAHPIMAIVVRASESHYDNLAWYIQKPLPVPETGNNERQWITLAQGFYGNQPTGVANPQAALALIDQIITGKLPLRKVEVTALEFGDSYQIPGAVPELTPAVP